MEELRVPDFGAVVSIRNQLSRWLLEEALPLWDRFGVDRAAGGYFESLSAGVSGGCVAEGSVRRGRVVARQIYVFSVGKGFGWRSGSPCAIDHGRAYLMSRMHLGDGHFLTALDAAGGGVPAPFSLYEQAFYLFALAHLARPGATPQPVETIARRCLERLRFGYGRESGGFEESDPPSLPLKSNPHMHLLEAALAWLAVTEGEAQRPWEELARELVGLCLTRFRDPRSGVIREYFDSRWLPAPGEAGRIVEPGHQFEWAWLLSRWARGPHGAAQRTACLEAACRLVEVGESAGVDMERGVAVNEIWDDMKLKDGDAKLWPQTERLKAWCARLEHADDAAHAAAACRGILRAAHGMLQYLRSDTPGLWHEVRLAHGGFPIGPSKASSFYHVACAIEVLDGTVRGSHAAGGGLCP